MELTRHQLETLFVSGEVLSSRMPEFLDAYTLHDSSLVEVHLACVPSFTTFLVIDWDLVWNSVIPATFGRLLIRIPIVYCADWTEGSWQDSTIGGAESRRLLDDQRAQLLEDGRNDLRAYQTDDMRHGTVRHPAMDDTVTRTTVEGISWCKLELLHSGYVEFVCINENGVAFPIPKPKPSGG